VHHGLHDAAATSQTTAIAAHRDQAGSSHAEHPRAACGASRNTASVTSPPSQTAIAARCTTSAADDRGGGSGEPRVPGQGHVVSPPTASDQQQPGPRPRAGRQHRRQQPRTTARTASRASARMPYPLAEHAGRARPGRPPRRITGGGRTCSQICASVAAAISRVPA
jgi:hypothetical protein